MEALLGQVIERLVRLETSVRALDDRLTTFLSRDVDTKKKNALRRQFYREKKQREQRGRLALPSKHILRALDMRVNPHYEQWASVGLRFAAQNNAAGFIAWLMYQWNNTVYLKKPITFSGSSFRVWNGYSRHAIGPGDLMHLYRKRVRMVPFLRTQEEADDFVGRDMWSWTQNVLFRVVRIMQESDTWKDAPDRFKNSLFLLAGAMCEHQVNGHTWDLRTPGEDMDLFNKQMKTVAHLWKPLVEALAAGLRATDCPPAPC